MLATYACGILETVSRGRTVKASEHRGLVVANRCSGLSAVSSPSSLPPRCDLAHIRADNQRWRPLLTSLTMP